MNKHTLCSSSGSSGGGGVLGKRSLLQKSLSGRFSQQVQYATSTTEIMLSFLCRSATNILILISAGTDSIKLYLPRGLQELLNSVECHHRYQGLLGMSITYNLILIMISNVCVTLHLPPRLSLFVIPYDKNSFDLKIVVVSTPIWLYIVIYCRLVVWP